MIPNASRHDRPFGLAPRKERGAFSHVLQLQLFSIPTFQRNPRTLNEARLSEEVTGSAL